MNEAQQSEIKEIVDCILRNVPVTEIYLFGSYAKGLENKDSDYNFYIVIPDDGIRPREAIWKIREAIPKQSRRIDLLVGSQSKFAKYRDTISFIEGKVARTGVKLHGLL